jgi:hypothetical protein
MPSSFRPGDKVTVSPSELDPIVLHMQRYATVVRGGERCIIQLSDTMPPNQQFEVAAVKLRPGWVPQDW